MWFFLFQDWYEAEGWEDFRRGKEYVQYQDFPFDMVRPKKDRTSFPILYLFQNP